RGRGPERRGASQPRPRDGRGCGLERRPRGGGEGGSGGRRARGARPGGGERGKSSRAGGRWRVLLLPARAPSAVSLWLSVARASAAEACRAAASAPLMMRFAAEWAGGTKP